MQKIFLGGKFWQFAQNGSIRDSEFLNRLELLFFVSGKIFVAYLMDFQPNLSKNVAKMAQIWRFTRLAFSLFTEIQLSNFFSDSRFLMYSGWTTKSTSRTRIFGFPIEKSMVENRVPDSSEIGLVRNP